MVFSFVKIKKANISGCTLFLILSFMKKWQEREPEANMSFHSKLYLKSVNPLTLQVSGKATDLLPEPTKENSLTKIQRMWADAYEPINGLNKENQ